MNKQLQEQLTARFPDIFSAPIVNDYWWDITVGDGWYRIVEDVSRQIEVISRASGIKITARQIKEKYGELRFYISTQKPDAMSQDEKTVWGQILTAVCRHAATRSENICEQCGAPGELREKNGWWLALCDRCQAVREQKQ